MTSLRERLLEPSTLVLDGGMGTALMARGLTAGEAPEAWCMSQPERVVEAHASYVEAGSEAVHTNTFGASPMRLAAFDLEGRCEVLNQAAVRLARESGARFVIGDVGPSGLYMAPVGDADPEALGASFLRQGRALAEAGVDAFHVETMTDLREATIAVVALRDASPDTPIFCSLTFDRKRRGFFTVMGDALASSLKALAALDVQAVGANCSIVSADMRVLALEALTALGEDGPALVLQANAGQPMMSGHELVYEQPPEAFADDAAAMARAGAKLVGGCCGTDPRFIAALRRQLAEDVP